MVLPALPDHLTHPATPLTVEEWVAEDLETTRLANPQAGVGGAPARVPTRAVVITMLLLVLEGSPPFLKEGAHLLHRRLSRSIREELGIIAPHEPDPTTRSCPANDRYYHRFNRAYHRLMRVLDPRPMPRRRRLTMDEYDTVAAQWEPMDQTVREERLRWVVNQVLELSVRAVPRAQRRRWKDSIAVDATHFPVFARRGSITRGWKSLEPDAGRYKRDNGKDVFAYEAELATMVTESPDGHQLYPNLLVGLNLHAPGVDPTGSIL